jgi:glycosyltransferase involved in cell wall biosynthesis
MSKWYHKYVEIYERPYDTVPTSIKEEIATKLRGLPSEQPLCSIVAIAHNEERHLAACLWSLCDNIVDFPIEIIVVDNASTDATPRIIDEMGVTAYHETRKGPGFARQCGLDHARGKYHICIDADTLYPPYYMATHVRHLQRNNTVCTYGLWSFFPDKEHSRTALFFYETARDLFLFLQNIKRPELCVRGMTLAFVTEYGKEIGYRTDIIRGEDGSMALKLKSYGKLKLICSRKARPVTSNSTLNSGGSLLQNTYQRAIKAFRSIKKLFTSKDDYVDGEDNLIK